MNRYGHIIEQWIRYKDDNRDDLSKEEISMINATCNALEECGNPREAAIDQDDRGTKLSYQDIKKAFNSICTSLPKLQNPQYWTEGRKKAIRSKKLPLEEWEQIFKRVDLSDFLSGRDGKWSGCSFDWILKPANLQKISEGNYDNTRNGGTGKQSNYLIDERGMDGFFDPIEEY